MNLTTLQTALLTFVFFGYTCNYSAYAMGDAADEAISKQARIPRVALPQDEETIQLVQTVTNTPITHFHELVQAFSSDREKTIQRLRSAYPRFESSDYPEKPQGDLKAASSQFENAVKALNIRFALGDREVVGEYEQMYRHVQRILCEEHAESNKKTYIFHLRNFSLLSPESRQAIAQSYREGNDPFEDAAEAVIYEQDLGLPLTPDLF